MARRSLSVPSPRQQKALPQHVATDLADLEALYGEVNPNSLAKERPCSHPRIGNNRLDSLRNIVADPRVAMLFLNPGIDETLRVNGRAMISTDQALEDRFGVDGKLPQTVLVFSIAAVYFQCARALIRSRLWDPDARWDKSCVPTAGGMTRAATPSFDAASYDTALPARQRATLC